MIDKSQAILHLCPSAQFSIRNGVVEWLDKNYPQPSEKEIQFVIDNYVPPKTIEDRIKDLEHSIQVIKESYGGSRTA